MRGRYVLVVVFVLTVVAGCSSGGSFSEEDALGVVQDAYEAYNSGDVNTWVDIRDKGSYYPTSEEQNSGIAYMRDEVAGEIQAGGKIEVQECVSHGYDEWAGIADVGTAEGFYVECTTTHTKPVEMQVLYRWVVDKDGVVAVNSTP